MYTLDGVTSFRVALPVVVYGVLASGVYMVKLTVFFLTQGRLPHIRNIWWCKVVQKVLEDFKT